MASARFDDETLDGATNLVVVSGELDMTNVGALRRHVGAALAAGIVRVVIDLTALTHMDSSGLAELLSLHQRATDLRGGVVLVVDSEMIKRTLQIRGVDGLLKVAPTRAAALATLDA